MNKTVRNRTDRKTYLRLAIAFCFFAGMALLIVGRLAKYQLKEYAYYQSQVLNQLTTEVNVNPERGDITDRNGVVLATNKSVYNIIISPKHIMEKNKENEENKQKSLVTVNEAEIKGNSRSLRPEYTFSNFVLGQSNRFAYLTAMNIAEAPHISTMNPLYIFGDVGLGKTHLMMAVGWYILSNNINANIIYTSAQQFADEYFAEQERILIILSNNFITIIVVLMYYLWMIFNF